MCGIAGYVGGSRTRDEAAIDLGAMCAAIAHRGPNHEGHFIDSGVALGMRRLSVIDVEGGAQPMPNEDGRIQVVFNGEIYNHRALRTRLAPAHRFRSRTDTEVLVHLYEEVGPELVHQLRGMFAFAVWDGPAARLTLARDRLGIKPLYYVESEQGLAFASELRSLLALDWFSPEIEEHAVHAYLALGYVPDHLSIFRGVRKLQPGHLLTWERGRGSVVRRYWSPVRPQIPDTDERELTEELQRLIADAVSSHLESDVPLGAFLSGGIDSSTVVTEMTRHSPAVETFAIGFDEPDFNEAPQAARVARALGTRHRELIVRPDADALIEQVVHTYDEPFGDSSALPTMLVCELASRHVTVALSGDGGDELFGGYTRYAELHGSRGIPSRPLRHLVRRLAGALPHGAWGRNRLLDLTRSRQGRYAATVAHSLPVGEGGVLRDAPGDLLLDSLLRPWFDAVRDRDFLTQMTLVDLATYLPGDILTKVDRASMSVSLEARVPLLDHHLVEFAVGLPGSVKRRDGTGKWLLRNAIRGAVPPAVLEQPKRGFGVPLNHWFRRELGYRLDGLLRPGRPIHRYVDVASVARLVREHRMARRDHSSMLWRLLVLDLWLDALKCGELARPLAGRVVMHR